MTLSELAEKKLHEEKHEEKKQEQRNNLFNIKPLSTWISEAYMRPTPQQLFDVFWYENEICILFADTNTGKSIFAVQIGDSISSGLPIHGFRKQAKRQPILYVDFELSDKQFQIRYTNEFGEMYNFHSDFFRAELNSDCDLPVGMNFEQFVIQSLETALVDSGIKILIIDNITYLRQDNEKGKDALSMMKELKALKKKYDLSILCLAHVPKRDNSKSITRNDLAGSKMLINFCDSAFAIGESVTDSSIRYLKQIKFRNDAPLYDAENVAVFRIEKPNCFLKFEFLKCTTELEHLRKPSNEDRETRIAEAKQMKAEGKTNIQIAAHFGLSEGAIRKWKL